MPCDFDGSKVYERDGVVLFWQPPAPFSQWTESPFTVEKKKYCCCEQFMMARKAKLFGDSETLGKILAGDHDPAAHKRLGRGVKEFNERVWEDHCDNIVVQGNYAKFTSNRVLLEALLDTGDSLLAEASPHDRVWGIGLRADDPDASDPARWRGKNRLGKALMKVRDQIRKERVLKVTV